RETQPVIRINLAPQKRKTTADRGQQSLLVGLLAIIGAGALIFFFVHSPLQDKLDKLDESLEKLRKDHKEKQKQLKVIQDREKVEKKIKQTEAMVSRLVDASANPSHMMRELSAILTTKGAPTVTSETSQNLSRQQSINLDWDAKHVWITKFTEKQGTFRIEGGAQSDSDMTQLALRLQASVYFRDVIPEGGKVVTEKGSNTTYYEFVIVGKVAY
ncbi:MAG: PilN domain-containing protein, partial [Myxococcota bacterium]